MSRLIINYANDRVLLWEYNNLHQQRSSHCLNKSEKSYWKYGKLIYKYWRFRVNKNKSVYTTYYYTIRPMSKFSLKIKTISDEAKLFLKDFTAI